MTFDQRETPVNDRVVARWLADRFPDRTAVDPEMHYVCRPVVDLSCTPGGARDRQLIYGEPFEVLERVGELAFGLSKSANYVGWVPIAALAAEQARDEPLTWVGTRLTHAYSKPDFKSPEVMALPHLAIVSAGQTEGRFTRTEAGWVPTVHLTQALTNDPVTLAETYLGTPYLWGGNSTLGIDCSGLVRNACLAVGIECPGDSDLQAKRLGQTVADPGDVRRADLFFWKGHVAMAVDSETLIHANVHHMAVATEPLETAKMRIEAQGDGLVTRHARLV